MSSSPAPEPTPPAPRPADPPAQHRVLAAVAAGGALGALARAGVARLFAPAGTGVDAATVLTNLIGCALLGALTAHLATGRHHPLLRPFAATGLLGGFTTFSTYAVHGRALVAGGHPWVALVEGVVSVAGGLGAAWAGSRAVRR